MSITVKKMKGISILELSITISLICLLIAIYISKFMILSANAERINLQQMRNTLSMSTKLAFIHEIQKSRYDITPDSCLNPIDYLEQKPKNYLGSLENPDPQKISGGMWYFNSRDCVLNYRVDHEHAFVTSLSPPARARFKVQKIFAKPNGLQNFRLEDLRFESLEPYRWRQ